MGNRPTYRACLAELIGSTSVAVESILRLQISATHFGPPRDRPCMRAKCPTATSTAAVRNVRLTSTAAGRNAQIGVVPLRVAGGQRDSCGGVAATVEILF